MKKEIKMSRPKYERLSCTLCISDGFNKRRCANNDVTLHIQKRISCTRASNNTIVFLNLNGFMSKLALNVLYEKRVNSMRGGTKDDIGFGNGIFN